MARRKKADFREGGATADAYCPWCMTPLSGGYECACGHEGADEDSPARAPHHIPAGTALANGRYLVGHALGQGGFGITYVGRDLTLNMRVAVKEYYPAAYVGRNSEVANDVVAFGPDAFERLQSGRERFLDEARALARFHSSPGIVDVRDFFEENNTAYIVMDYLQGETLKSYLKRGPMQADRAFELMRPIADALAAMHEQRVVHRDISPDNIMMCEDGTLRLMDFGAAHAVDREDTRSVSMVLKSGYAPEEQYRAKGELGPWTDIYALCATLYRCITGVAPDESLQRLVSDEMAWPSEIGVRITLTQERVLKKGMALRHGERYRSIAEMQADLAADKEHATDVRVAGEVSHDMSEVPAAGDPDPKRGRRVGVAAKVAVVAAVVCIAVACAVYFMLAPAHTVSFDSAGGSEVDAVVVNRIDVVNEPEPPVRENYDFAGWYLDEALSEHAAFPLKVDSDTTLHAAWERKRTSYRIECLDVSTGDKIADDKVVKDAEVGTDVTVKAPDIDGYSLDSKRKAKLSISEDKSKNVVTFKYRKLVSYEVRYVDASGNEVAPAKTVDGVVEGDKVTEEAPDVSGYNLASDREQTVKLSRDSKDNVITFTYEPVPAPEPQVVYYHESSGGGSSGGRSSSGSGKSTGSGDVNWAN